MKKLKENTNFELKTDLQNLAQNDTSVPYTSKVKKNAQKVSSFIAGMVTPGVSIIIVWGILTAFFGGSYDENSVWHATGFFNVEPLGMATIAIIKYLMPLLIGFTAGSMIYGKRGGTFSIFVITMVIVGTDWIYIKGPINNWIDNSSAIRSFDIPNQIVSAMIVAPITTWIFKKIELIYIQNIRQGFEMLAKNFSLALWSLLFGITLFWSWGFVIYGISFAMFGIIENFSKLPWSLPFLSFLTEPLRAAFFNNALNYGLIVPLGIQEAEINNYSPLFMITGNPGQGFGLLIAYIVWRKNQRLAAGTSSIVQILGGVHEVHYAYLIAEPIMVLATIFGSFTSLMIVSMFGGGTNSIISPGSIISVIIMSGSGYRILINTLAIFSGALVSFVIASIIMIWKKAPISENKSISSSDLVEVWNDKYEDHQKNKFNWKEAKLLMVACDAGVGSSAIGASIIRKFVQKNNIDIEVQNCAIKDLNSEVDILVTMHQFAEVAQGNAPNAKIYTIKQYLGQNVYKELEDDLIKYKSKY